MQVFGPWPQCAGPFYRELPPCWTTSDLLITSSWGAYSLVLVLPFYPDRRPLVVTCLGDPGEVPSFRDLVGSRNVSSSSDDSVSVSVSVSNSDSDSSPELSPLGSTANVMLKSSRSSIPLA